MPEAITAGGFTPVAPQNQMSDALGGLDGEAFLRLLVAQMRYQNPMSPSDPSAMLEQTTQLRQVETLNQVARTQQQMLGMHQASMASGLVGKTVTALDLDGSTVTGTVDGVRFTPVGPVLLIGDRQIPLDATAEIGAAPATQPTA